MVDPPVPIEPIPSLDAAILIVPPTPVTKNEDALIRHCSKKYFGQPVRFNSLGVLESSNS
jgi:hypothetical protein